MFRTIQLLRHHIRTVHGVSSTSFSSDPAAPPPQGIGQGIGAGPAIWCVVSTPILNMLWAAGHGIKFHSPLSGSDTQVVVYVFVDDCDMCETAPDWECPSNQLLASMQASLDLWEGGLQATGGALVPDNSHWYFVLFRWNRQGEFCYATPQEKLLLFFRSVALTTKENPLSGYIQVMLNEPWVCG